MNGHFNNDGLVFNLTLESSFNFICMKCCACCFNRHIEPNKFEISQLAKYLQLPISAVKKLFLIPERNNLIRNKNDGSCIFLNPSGCSIYPARPLVCRIYPLGLLFGPQGEEKWGLMPLHPDCLGLITNNGTVEGYLISQAASPYLRYEYLLKRMSK